ncbi:DNA-binding MarR family transcriptional regulator [Sphingomonas vulcanisoli]|uniref:DNA-binding MarR family transcriptional regulator n=1 Tax=Sphingomonas vulcanisoli TaxID=1658060 RepID=A0ABX0TQP4_9SPHN|nr:MarR family transcriptional regulator [Sphingomonas vulcanisoli]NIJ07832.1 DNA-binding MarR family transcriptional regulator [Sphingomonas vulcanisoli]
MAAKVLILSDDPGCEAELGGLVRAAGGWVAATGTPQAFEGKFDLILADLRGFEAFERFADGDTPIIAQIDAQAIDAAAAILGKAELLVDPDAVEWAAAIAVALAQDGASVRETGLPALRQLSEEAGRIARALADLAAAAPAVTHPPVVSAPSLSDGAPINAAFVRRLIRKRRLRERFFAAEIFADPAWDMLLDLYAARLEGAQVAVSSLCIAAHVPPTTALRWIRALTDQGLFLRLADPADRRRMFVALSEGAAERMAAYLALAEG